MAANYLQAIPEERATVHFVKKGVKLNELQDSLPELPVADLEASVRRMQRSVEPLHESEAGKREFDELVDRFLQEGEGAELQKLLQNRAEERKRGPYPRGNWLEEWWDRLAYLGGRDPVAINSNFFGTCFHGKSLGFDRLQVAVGLILSVVKFKRLLDAGELPPDALDRKGRMPLCSFQYSRLFCSSRVPGTEVDRFESHGEAKHVVVHCRGHWWNIQVIMPDGHLISPLALYTALKRVDAHSSLKTGSSLGLMTTEMRTTWAKTREDCLVADPLNQKSLDAVEGAIFHLSLSEQRPRNKQEVMLYAETGDPHVGDYWFDKSCTVFVYANHKIGFGGEHGHADAPVPCRVVLVMAVRTLEDNVMQQLADLSSHAKGQLDLLADSDSPIPHCQHLQWNMTAPLNTAIETARQRFAIAVANNELAVLENSSIRRETCKALGLSPDSVVQMALQLAYYRDQGGEFTATYETATTRGFYHARTDTIRPLSTQSCQWVKAMEAFQTTDQLKWDLLRTAMKTHSEYVRSACFAQAWDRHFLGLRMIAVENGIKLPALLLHPVLRKAAAFGLSTSNMTMGTQDVPGFGAPFPFSYGVCYNIGSDGLTICLTSNRTCTQKSATRFSAALQQAFLDIIALAKRCQPNTSKL